MQSASQNTCPWGLPDFIFAIKSIIRIYSELRVQIQHATAIKIRLIHSETHIFDCVYHIITQLALMKIVDAHFAFTGTIRFFRQLMI